MKKIILIFLMIFSINLCFADGNPYLNTLNSRKDFTQKGLSDISSYLVEISANDSQKQQIKNTTQTIIFDINELIKKNISSVQAGETINAKNIQKQINAKVEIYKTQLQKYSDSGEIPSLISDFENGLQNIYISNFQKSNDDSTIDFQKQNYYYNKLYQKLNTILQKYPGGSYKTFLEKLKSKVDEKKKSILNSKISEQKKEQYINLYETLELVISDFEV